MVWSTLGPGPWPLVSWWCLYTTQAGRQAGSQEGQVAGERSWFSQAIDTTRACCDWLRPVRGTCLENHSPGGATNPYTGPLPTSSTWGNGRLPLTKFSELSSACLDSQTLILADAGVPGTPLKDSTAKLKCGRVSQIH